MNTSSNITQHRDRNRGWLWHRGVRTWIAGILLMCLLSACAVPMTAWAEETGMSPEVTETSLTDAQVPDNDVPNESIIAQDTAAGTSEADIIGEIADAEGTEPVQTHGDSETPEMDQGAEPPGESLTEPTSDLAELSAENPEQEPSEELADEALMNDAPMLLMADEPAMTALADTTWQDDYDYSLNKTEGTIYLTNYKKKTRSDYESLYKDNLEDLVVPATAVVKGVSYQTIIYGSVYQNAYYLRSVRFEDGCKSGSTFQDLFSYCFNLESVDLGAMDTTALTTMTMMFANCMMLRSVDLSMFDTSNVEYMRQMFVNCYRLESVRVSGLNTAKAHNMWNMFADCMSLKELDLSGWNTRAVWSMDGIFSVGLERLTVGPDFKFYKKYSYEANYAGLLGTWTDGSKIYTAEELQEELQGDRTETKTYTRISYGDGKALRNEQTQASLSLPDGYTPTNALTAEDMRDTAQRNGRISDVLAIGDGRLAKIAEWTDQDAGDAEINLAYAVPEQKGSRAVFAFGTCNCHGFGADKAITQMMELLDQYDYVDVLTNSSQFWRLYYQKQDFLSTSRKVAFTLTAADGRAANISKLVALFTPDLSDLDNYNIINWGAHATAAMIPTYLKEYLAQNTPAAIYVSVDGSRGFSNDSSTGHVESVAQILYGTSQAGLADKTYEDLLVDEDLLQTLAEYQRDGRYYICICKEETNYTKAYFNTDSSSNDYHWTRLLCYASFTLMNPYYYVYQNENLRAYLDGTYGWKEYASFPMVGNRLLNYGKSFTSQNVQYITTPLTITDTIADGLTVHEEDISVSLIRGGIEVTDLPDIQITVEGQNVRVYLSEVSGGEIVYVRIPVKAVGNYETEDHGFRDTNVGPAKAVTAAGNTVSVESPRLFKGTYRIQTEVVNGTITDSVTEIPIGDTREITYEPNEGYHLESITVDGETVDPEIYESSYVFADITGDHTIRVVYTLDEEPETPDPETPDDQKDEPETPDDPAPSDPAPESHDPETSGGGNNTAVTTTVIKETPAVPAAVLLESGTVQLPIEPAAANPAVPATGDDSRILLWLALVGAATLMLLGWIAASVRRME